MSNWKWTAAIVILFLLFVYLLLRFWFSALHTHGLVKPLKAPASSGNPPRHIVLISQETDNPFWRAIEQGAREASEKYGMHLEFIGPFRINPAEQIKLLEKTIAAKADAVVIQGINDPNYRSLIDKAEAQEIPVITVDTDEPGSRRLSYVGTDNLKAGVMMGELVVQASGARGKVGVLISNEQADNQQLRLKGFRSVISRYPELTIVAVRSSDISRLQAAQQAEVILQHDPKVGYMVGFSALDGVGILKASDRLRTHGLHIFAFDDLPETTQAAQQCRIASTLVQQPHEMGYSAVSLLNDYFHGKKPQAQHFTDIAVVTCGAISSGAGGQGR